mgnify:CR=1 FL=1
MSNIKLIHGDCLVEHNKIPDKSIDVIFSDLPYGTTNCKWDSLLDLEYLKYAIEADGIDMNDKCIKNMVIT